MASIASTRAHTPAPLLPDPPVTAIGTATATAEDVVWPTGGGIITGRVGTGKTHAAAAVASAAYAGAEPVAVVVCAPSRDLLDLLTEECAVPAAPMPSTADVDVLVAFRSGWQAATHRDPRVLVFVDDAHVLLARATPEARDRWGHIARAGRAVGVHVIATAPTVRQVRAEAPGLAEALEDGAHLRVYDRSGAGELASGGRPPVAVRLRHPARYA
jgi:hypothetical protein